MTSDLAARIDAHKKHLVEGFTNKYDVTMLVYFESCDSRETALIREKRLKEWKRAWKLALIEKHNPQWRDLFDDLTT